MEQKNVKWKMKGTCTETGCSLYCRLGVLETRRSVRRVILIRRLRFERPSMQRRKLNHAFRKVQPCISASGTMQVAKSNHASCRAEPCKFACAWLRSRVSIHWLFLQLSDMDFGPKGYLDANIPRARAHTRALLLYAGHDTRSGVKVSNGPVRRNQIAEDKLASARVRAKEVGSEVRRTRTESGYKAFSRASRDCLSAEGGDSSCGGGVCGLRRLLV